MYNKTFERLMVFVILFKHFNHIGLGYRGGFRGGVQGVRTPPFIPNMYETIGFMLCVTVTQYRVALYI